MVRLLNGDIFYLLNCFELRGDYVSSFCPFLCGCWGVGGKQRKIEQGWRLGQGESDFLKSCIAVQEARWE